jgi:hypothetical protein
MAPLSTSAIIHQTAARSAAGPGVKVCYAEHTLTDTILNFTASLRFQAHSEWWLGVQNNVDHTRAHRFDATGAS